MSLVQLSWEAPWVRGGPWGAVDACGGRPCGGSSSGVLWWCLGGLRTEMGGVCGARSRLVLFWVMHGMAIDVTQHVFPRSWVGELLCLCQQKAFAVYHLGHSSADCF